VGAFQETTQSILVPVEIGVSTIVADKLLGAEEAIGVSTVIIAGSELPDIFEAITLNVYVVFAVNPVNVNVLVDAFVLPDKLSGDPVILYPVTGAPPSELGGSHVIVELITSVTAMLDEAFLGEKIGRKTVDTLTTAGDELPATFVVVTLNVYNVFTVNPVNVNVLTDAIVVPEKPPGDAVIIYPVTGNPPLEVGAFHETVELITFVRTDLLVVRLVGGLATVGVVTVIVSGDDRPD